MKFDYTLELNKILENIYKEMTYTIAIKNPNLEFSKNNISKIKSTITSENVYLGNDMDEFIINNIPDNLEGDLFRCEIAKFHNRLHPKFVNYKGEPVSDSGYNKFALLLWEEHMNKALIDDIQSLFSQEGFVEFVNNKLELHLDDLINRINTYSSRVVTIKFDRKEYLLNVVKNMITRGELDFDYAHMLVDLDKLREDMAKVAASFNIYNEFDKLEDDTRYCLDNYAKYNTFELYDFLVNNQGFELVSEGILVKHL